MVVMLFCLVTLQVSSRILLICLARVVRQVTFFAYSQAKASKTNNWHAFWYLIVLDCRCRVGLENYTYVQRVSPSGLWMWRSQRCDDKRCAILVSISYFLWPRLRCRAEAITKSLGSEHSEALKALSRLGPWFFPCFFLFFFHSYITLIYIV